jgi:hypothetical protein
MTKRTDQISIIDYLTDAQLLGLTASEAQETLLRAGFGLPPGSKSQCEIYPSVYWARILAQARVS